jgi:DNA excision repair protein ERCC-3
MSYNPSNPIIIQSDKTLLVEVNNDLYEEVRDQISRFAELEKSPEYIHTYKISPLSLWNAASSGMTSEKIIEILESYSKYEVPQNVIKDIEHNIQKYGKIKLIKEENRLILICEDKYLMTEILNYKSMDKYILEKIDEHKVIVNDLMRGSIKQFLIKLGYPVEDLAGYIEGTKFDTTLRKETLQGKELNIIAKELNVLLITGKTKNKWKCL